MSNTCKLSYDRTPIPIAITDHSLVCSRRVEMFVSEFARAMFGDLNMLGFDHI